MFGQSGPAQMLQTTHSPVEWFRESNMHVPSPLLVQPYMRPGLVSLAESHIVVHQLQNAVKCRHGVEQRRFRVQPKLAVHVVDAYTGGAPLRPDAQREQVPGVGAVTYQERTDRRRLQEFAGLQQCESLVVESTVVKPSDGSAHTFHVQRAIHHRGWGQPCCGGGGGRGGWWRGRACLAGARLGCGIGRACTTTRQHCFSRLQNSSFPEPLLAPRSSPTGTRQLNPQLSYFPGTQKPALIVANLSLCL